MGSITDQRQERQYYIDWLRIIFGMKILRREKEEMDIKLGMKPVMVKAEKSL